MAGIRWFGQVAWWSSWTFFTNLVLMAAFLGMSVGCMAASRKARLSQSVLPLTLLTVTLSCLALGTYFLLGRYGGRLRVGVGDSGGSPQEVFFGTEKILGG